MSFMQAKIISIILFFLLTLHSVAQVYDSTRNNLPPLSELTTDKCKIIYIDGYKYLQRDFSKVLDAFYHTEPGDSSEEAMENRQRLADYSKPHPSVETLEFFFKEAAREFDVPVYLLEVIGEVESNWTQFGGPSIDQGYGIMHLVQINNAYQQPIDEAASLLKLNRKTLREDARQNIRGAAALIAKYAGDKREQFTTYVEWAPSVKKFIGFHDALLEEMEWNEYLKILYNGCNSLTLWGERVKISPQPTRYK